MPAAHAFKRNFKQLNLSTSNKYHNGKSRQEYQKAVAKMTSMPSNVSRAFSDVKLTQVSFLKQPIKQNNEETFFLSAVS